MEAERKIRRRRKTCWWEPTYAPELVGALAEGKWEFQHARGPTRCHFNADGYAEAARAASHKFTQIAFTDCDFEGFFQLGVQVAFSGCRFQNCDFGLTTWTNVKFSNCEFSSCSFGMTTFNNCEFRSCKWEFIGISPNMLQINSTYISNSSDFISAAYTNLNAQVLLDHRADHNEQVMKLEQTKATISRRLLRNLQEEGDEGAFYNAVKTFQLQQARARRFQADYEVIKASGSWQSFRPNALRIMWSIEEQLLKIIGKTNDWGASIVRPILFTVLLTFLMSAVYHWMCAPHFKAEAALQRSFDMTILAGYGNYNGEDDLLTIVVQNIHVVAATLLHAITFTTIVARLVRVR